jgi:predicted ATPase
MNTYRIDVLTLADIGPTRFNGDVGAAIAVATRNAAELEAAGRLGAARLWLDVALELEARNA